MTSKGTSKATGTGGGDPTYPWNQAETQLSLVHVGSEDLGSVTYNDGTDNDSSKITYGQSSRVVYSGASMLGWSWTNDYGNTWHKGKLWPVSGWPILWGDPAMTSNLADSAYVYISSIAVPSSKYSGGIIGDDMANHLGGACIARSSDGGKTFSLSASDCLHTGNYDFYDGGSMASDVSGVVYAAFVDPPLHQIHVWKAPNKTAAFTQIASPFSGIWIVSHPRLRVDPVYGKLYCAAQDNSNRILLARLDGSNWSSPAVAYGNNNIQEVYPTIALANQRLLRAGPQFSFDIAPTTDSNYASNVLRIAVTVKYTAYPYSPNSPRYGINGTYCSRDLACNLGAAPWYTYDGNTQGDQFNPILVASTDLILGGAVPVYKVSYLSRQDDPTGMTVSVVQGEFKWNPTSFPTSTVSPSHEVCSDIRGYWGDYDDLKPWSIDQNTGQRSFVRAFADSTAGCDIRKEYTSHNVHVTLLTMFE